MTKELMKSLLSSRELLALTIYGEARGESIFGKIAVACVIRNRVQRGGKSYVDIILAPFQFSCWNESDPNYPILMELAQDVIDGTNTTKIDELLWIASGIISGVCDDVTHGAVNYLTKSLYNSTSAPSWASKMINTKIIDSHIFGSFA